MRIVIRKPRWLRRRSDDDDDNELPPPSRRQRLIVAAAAVGITVAIGAALLAPHFESMRAKQLGAQPKPCGPGQTRDCVGGTMNAVIVAPAASAAAR
jgi:hypothetical protein